jgi:predicted nucleic acid-binding protein
MYLIDTSVWIDYFREKNNQSVQQLNQILDDDMPFGITGLIYQEILQGSMSTNDFVMLRDYFSTQHFFHPKDNIVSYQMAAKIYFDCRRKGITIKSVVDCIIAQIAMEQNLILLHNDSDYIQISKVLPKLRLH